MIQSNDQGERQPPNQQNRADDPKLNKNQNLAAVRSTALLGDNFPSKKVQPVSKPIVLDLSAPIFEQNEARHKIAKNLQSPDQSVLRIVLKGLSESQRSLLRLGDWSQSPVSAKEYLQKSLGPTFEQRSLIQVS